MTSSEILTELVAYVREKDNLSARIEEDPAMKEDKNYKIHVGYRNACYDILTFLKSRCIE